MAWHLALYVIVAIALVALVGSAWRAKRRGTDGDKGDLYHEKENFAVRPGMPNVEPNPQPPRSKTYGQE